MTPANVLPLKSLAGFVSTLQTIDLLKAVWFIIILKTSLSSLVLRYVTFRIEILLIILGLAFLIKLKAFLVLNNLSLTLTRLTPLLFTLVTYTLLQIEYVRVGVVGFPLLEIPT